MLPFTTTRCMVFLNGVNIPSSRRVAFSLVFFDPVEDSARLRGKVMHPGAVAEPYSLLGDERAPEAGVGRGGHDVVRLRVTREVTSVDPGQTGLQDV